MNILEQIQQYHGTHGEQIEKIFTILFRENDMKEYTAIEVLEQTAKDNRLGNEKIPQWFYDCIPYDSFCEYIESLDIIELGNDFIKMSYNEYYFIGDIVALVEK